MQRRLSIGRYVIRAHFVHFGVRLFGKQPLHNAHFIGMLRYSKALGSNAYLVDSVEYPNSVASVYDQAGRPFHVILDRDKAQFAPKVYGQEEAFGTTVTKNIGEVCDVSVMETLVQIDARLNDNTNIGLPKNILEGVKQALKLNYSFSVTQNKIYVWRKGSPKPPRSPK